MLRSTPFRRSILAAANTEWLVPHTGPSLPRRIVTAAHRASRLRKFLALTLGPTALGGLYLYLSSAVCDRFEDGYDVMYVEREVDTTLLTTDVFHMVEPWEMRAQRLLSVGDVVLYTGTDAESRNAIKAQFAASGWRSGAHKYSNVGVVVRAYDPATGEGPFILEASRNREGLPDWRGVVRRDCVMVVDATKRLFGMGIIGSDGREVFGLEEATSLGWAMPAKGEAGEAAQKKGGASSSLSPPSSQSAQPPFDRASFEAATKEDYYDPLTPHPPRPFPLYKRAAYRRIVTDGGSPASAVLTTAEHERFVQSVNAFVQRFEGQPMDTLGLGPIATAAASSTHGGSAPSTATDSTNKSRREVLIGLCGGNADTTDATANNNGSGSIWAVRSATLRDTYSRAAIAVDAMWAATEAAWTPKRYTAKREALLRELQQRHRDEQAERAGSTVAVTAPTAKKGAKGSAVVAADPPLSPFPTTVVAPAELVGLFYECVGFSTVVDAKGARRYTDSGELWGAAAAKGPASGGLLFTAGQFFGKLSPSALFGAGAAAAGGATKAEETEQAEAVRSTPLTFEEKKAAWLAQRRAEKEARMGIASAPAATSAAAASVSGVGAPPSPPALGNSNNTKKAFPLTDAAVIANPNTFSRLKAQALLPGHFANNMNYHVADEIELVKENERKALGITDHLLFGLAEKPTPTTSDSGANNGPSAAVRTKVDKETGEEFVGFNTNIFARDAAALRKTAEAARLRSALRLDERFALTPEARVVVPAFSDRWVWEQDVRGERLRRNASAAAKK